MTCLSDLLSLITTWTLKHWTIKKCKRLKLSRSILLTKKYLNGNILLANLFDKGIGVWPGKRGIPLNGMTGLCRPLGRFLPKDSPKMGIRFFILCTNTIFIRFVKAGFHQLSGVKSGTFVLKVSCQCSSVDPLLTLGVLHNKAGSKPKKTWWYYAAIWKVRE